MAQLRGSTKNYHNKRMDKIYDEKEAQKMAIQIANKMQKHTKFNQKLYFIILHSWIPCVDMQRTKHKTDYIISN